jgi:hypothetical protein
MPDLDRDVFPASFAQERLWFLEMLEQARGAITSRWLGGWKGCWTYWR